MKDPARWGNVRLTKSLREGQPGIPAVPLYRPFAGWVARGWRREKYLHMSPASGDHKLYYLYSTAGAADGGDFDQDSDDLGFALGADGDVDAELARRQNDPASQIRSAVVGIGLLDYIEDDVRLAFPDEHRAWVFSGGTLLPKPIPLSRLANRPYGGVFYPFGRLTGALAKDSKPTD